MKLERINLEIVNKLYKSTKLQTVLDEFMASDAIAVRCVFEPGEYSSTASAQSSYRNAIRRLGYPIAARVLKGDMYLIKLKTDNET